MKENFQTIYWGSNAGEPVLCRGVKMRFVRKKLWIAWIIILGITAGTLAGGGRTVFAGEAGSTGAEAAGGAGTAEAGSAGGTENASAGKAESIGTETAGEAGSTGTETAGKAGSAGTESVFTQEERDFIASLGTLKVGYVQDRVPVSYRDGKTGELGGISREIFDRIGEISGLQFDYVELPYGSVTYDYLWEQGFDLITGVEYNEENLHARGILMSQPYLKSKKVVVGRSDLSFRRDAELSVAVALGSQTFKRVIQNRYPNFVCLDYETLDECFEAVRNGEADILMYNQYIVEYLLSRPRYENLHVLPIESVADELCFSAVTPLGMEDEERWNQSEAVISIINKAIDQITEDQISNIVIKVTMEERYQYRLSDFLYRYRYSITLLTLSLCILLVMIGVIMNVILKSAKVKAESKAQRDFLSAMSHEIRTPLNGMMGLNYLMMQNLGEKDKLSVYLQQSTTTAKYLLTLVNDVLDMSELHHKRLSLKKKEISFRLVVSTVEALARRWMEEKGIAFQTDIRIPYPGLIGDEGRLEQVFMNILDNAWKFTPTGGSVTMKVEQELAEDGDVISRVSVADTGCGMSQEFQEKIFQSFTQERDTVSRGNQGTGLGMAISYHLIQQMDGDLSVESVPGKGSTFTFYFKTQAAEEPRTEYDPFQEETGEGKKCVLIAEDNELNAEILQEMLEEKGYRVILAADGQKAVEIFRNSGEGEIEVILMDLMMPVMSGHEAAKAIRKLPRADAGKVKIVACSANSLEEDRQKAKESGMDDFLAKPVEVDQLFAVLEGN